MAHYTSLLDDRRSLPQLPYFSPNRTSPITPLPGLHSKVTTWPTRSPGQPPSSVLHPPNLTRSNTVSDSYSTPYADPDANAASPASSSLASPPPPPPALAPAPVKEEQPDNDGFIIDLASAAPLPLMLAPPTEASARMRRMMGVFRLNPFAMHTQGGRGVLAPWAGGEAGPLEEEPLIFEFQLEITPDVVEAEHADTGKKRLQPKLEEEDQAPLSDSRRGLSSLDAPGLRAFSPDFELIHSSESNWELGYPPLSAFRSSVDVTRVLFTLIR
ncbi:hypothetical protein R3P38DRAFT_3324078 [Favolaschia claudopus]|uniref:Uncharacterized protein n=1 Tax=Favolaschia claudopus TaxID=2862362 RepID=A0AAW0AJ40_9AGAR